MQTSIRIERPSADELVRLFAAVGWAYGCASAVGRSIAAYPCTICARTESEELVGYLSAFSDEVMSTMLGELIVSPQWRRRGLASSMVSTLEQRYPNAPIYIKALGESRHFYEAVGFKIPKGELTVMFKRPVAA